MVYTVDEIKEKIRPIAKKYRVKEMFLFGSYAKGEADEKSDIDIAVKEDETEYLIEHYFDFLDELKEVFQLDVDVIFLDNVQQSATRFENRFAPRFESEKVRVA